MRNFVQVSSEFYPQLAAYYDQRIAAWFAENVPAADDGDEESNRTSSASGDDHE